MIQNLYDVFSGWGKAPRVPPGIDRTISERDEMYAASAEHYFWWGEDAVRRIERTLKLADAPPPRSILDLPCGHGRELRFLRAKYPDARIVACDLDTEAVDFCVRTFGVPGVYSHEEPSEIPIAERFDLIWVGSLLTHLDEGMWRGFLRFFSERLHPGGVLIFSSHGPTVVKLFRQDHHLLHNDPEISRELLQSYGERGFGYAQHENGGSYGISLASPDWTKARIAETDNLRLLEYVERGWCDHHDTAACIRIG